MLKALYAFCKCGSEPNEYRKHLEQCSREGRLGQLWNFEAQKNTADNDLELRSLNIITSHPIVINIESTSGSLEFVYPLIDQGMPIDETYTSLPKKTIPAVFIPATEMLSHSEGLVAMSKKYGVPFDQTQIDILINSQLWETKEISDRNRKILDMLGKAIDGVVIYENDTFYAVKNSGLKIEFALEAEGFKRLGLLWKLVRNGLLESGSVLLWDEPESSVHPDLMHLIAEVLHILAQDGVQIFIATHSYMFAKYVDLKKRNEDDVLFISLYKHFGIVECTTADSYSSLGNNAIEVSEEKLYEAIVESAMEDM